MDMHNPTEIAYRELSQAFDHFNATLFDGELPFCFISTQRKSGSSGYFAGGRMGTRDGSEVTDELALNPNHFKDQTPEQILSTLVRGMVSAWQHHFGKTKSRAGYHNAEWAMKMRSIGLIPSETGAPGGRQTGQRMFHYIEAGGRFEREAYELLKRLNISYVDLEGDLSARAEKNASKTKYTCGVCGAAAWGAPTIKLVCVTRDCNQPMASNVKGGKGAGAGKAGGARQPKPEAAPEPIRLEGSWPLLGIPRSATKAEIRAAYRKKSKACHPDQGGDAAAFRALTAEMEEALAYFAKRK